jgi:protein SFI1
MTDRQRPTVPRSYYRFILKLGSIPGGNWGERWARWLSDSRELASSSSARSSPVLGAREHLADSISGTEYDDEDEQASQSAVGYGMAGSQAGPFSTRSLSPPLRTSTPLARRRPPPRPSSVVHQQPRLHEPTPRRLGQGPAHMLAASPPPPPPPQRLEPLPKRISQSRAAIEEELRREDEERARQREDERRADVFCDIGLMGRCWDVWRKGREWVTVRRSFCCRLPSAAPNRQAS